MNYGYLLTKRSRVVMFSTFVFVFLASSANAASFGSSVQVTGSCQWGFTAHYSAWNITEPADWPSIQSLGMDILLTPSYATGSVSDSNTPSGITQSPSASFPISPFSVPGFSGVSLKMG